MTTPSFTPFSSNLTPPQPENPNHQRSPIPQRSLSLLWLAIAAALGFLATVAFGSKPSQSSASDAAALTEGRRLLNLALDAHGGIDRWNRFRQMRYEMVGFPLSPEMAKPNVYTVHLSTRQNRIDGEGYTVGFDGANAWSTPGAKASGLPSRFVSLGSFYFAGIPFVFADPGVQVRSLGEDSFQGQTYLALGVSYNSGVGHSSEDDYVVFLDPETYRVVLIHHNVTELYDDTFRVTWTYDAYQEVSRLWIPQELTFFKGWSREPKSEDGATYSINKVKLSRVAPSQKLFQAPEDAVLNDAE